jgi:hypothetical protein
LLVRVVFIGASAIFASVRMKHLKDNKQPSKRQIKVRLRRIAPDDRSGFLYDNEKIFLDVLLSYIKEGLQEGETVIILASAKHIFGIEELLKLDGFDVFHLRLRDQIIRLDADLVLEKFVLNGVPDKALFTYFVMNIAARTLKHDKNIRVFSELTAMLWFRGFKVASVQLEAIWNSLLDSNTEFPHVLLETETFPPEESREASQKESLSNS